MVAFVDAHGDKYGVEPICKVLPIAPSTYYEHKARQADPTRLPPRVHRDAVLCDEIERVWNDNFQVSVPPKCGDSSVVKAGNSPLHDQALDAPDRASGRHTRTAFQSNDDRGRDRTAAI